MDTWNDTVWCEGCGIEVTGPPVGASGRVYCCPDCFTSWGCACGEDLEGMEIRQSGSDRTEAIPLSLLAAAY